MDIDAGDPWESTLPPVKILDVRRRWVRYSMGAIFNDERKPIHNFMSIYSRVEEEEK